MKLVVGNIKMNILYRREREQYIQSLRNNVAGNVLSNTKIVLCPPFVHIESFSKVLPRGLELGAQNLFWERKGSYTGEISPIMLKELGCTWVIVGHSERRIYLGETDDMVRRKIAMALESGLSIILCIGETADQRNAGMTNAVLEQQLREGLRDISGANAQKIVIAYEPVWSIGTGLTPEINDIVSAREHLVYQLLELYGSSIQKEFRILYGGSVSSLNTRMVCIDTGMDGVLVGRESLQPEEFSRIAGIVDLGK